MFVTLEVGDIMPKITKAKARKRLNECMNKLNLVMFVTDLDLSSADNNKMMKMWEDLRRIKNKLK